MEYNVRKYQNKCCGTAVGVVVAQQAKGDSGAGKESQKEGSSGSATVTANSLDAVSMVQNEEGEEHAVEAEVGAGAGAPGSTGVDRNLAAVEEL